MELLRSGGDLEEVASGGEVLSLRGVAAPDSPCLLLLLGCHEVKNSSMPCVLPMLCCYGPRKRHSSLRLRLRVRLRGSVWVCSAKVLGAHGC